MMASNEFMVFQLAAEAVGVIAPVKAFEAVQNEATIHNSMALLDGLKKTHPQFFQQNLTTNEKMNNFIRGRAGLSQSAAQPTAAPAKTTVKATAAQTSAKMAAWMRKQIR